MNKGPLVLLSLMFLGGILFAMSPAIDAHHDGFSAVQSIPFSLEEGFESGIDPFRSWATDGSYDVLEKGVTEEHARSGKRSFKIDVRFERGSYFYWSLPISGRVPAEGQLRLRAHVRIDAATTGRVQLGVNYVYPPTRLSGINRSEADPTKKNEWQEIQLDVAAGAPRNADGVLARYLPGMSHTDVGLLIDRIGLLLFGRPGERVIVYVDDVVLEGEVPDPGVYDQVINARYDAHLEESQRTLSGYQEQIAGLRNEVSALRVPAGERSKAASRLYTALEETVIQVGDMLAVQERQGRIDPEAYIELPRLIASIERGTANLQVLDRHAPTDMVHYAVTPIDANPILPDTRLIRGEAFSELHITVPPGEYAPASCVVQSTVDVSGIEAVATDLQRTDPATNPAFISRDAVDIRLVKSWFQAGSAMISLSQDTKKRVLVPELLLYDDSLVRVDEATESNFLKVSDVAGTTREVPISTPDDPHWSPEGGRAPIPLDELPVRDADSLLPFDLAGGKNKQLWLTIHVPSNTQPGTYQGEVLLISQGEQLAGIPLTVEVLPFRLPPSPLVYSIYYRGRLDPVDEGSISSDLKNVQQFWAEAENMVAHGVTKPTLYQSLGSEPLLSKTLHIWKLAGMDTDRLYHLGVQTGNPTDAIGLAALQQRVRRSIEIAKEAAFDEVYVYGFDEARGERLKSQRAAWEAVHEAGGKVFVAGYEDAFDLVGDVLDTLVWSGRLSSDAAASWHGAGKTIFSYGNPQGGVEDPEIYRRNYGLLLWHSGYDGAMTYAYQDSFGNIWNDFDHTKYRDHNFTYPTVDGVIDTIQWEGFREAVNDVRYVAMLEQTIAQARQSDEPELLVLADEAQTFLDTLDPHQDLGFLRAQIITRMLTLLPR
jgi:hypothetical protein